MWFYHAGRISERRGLFSTAVLITAVVSVTTIRDVFRCGGLDEWERIQLPSKHCSVRDHKVRRNDEVSLKGWRAPSVSSFFLMEFYRLNIISVTGSCVFSFFYQSSELSVYIYSCICALVMSEKKCFKSHFTVWSQNWGTVSLYAQWRTVLNPLLMICWQSWILGLQAFKTQHNLQHLHSPRWGQFQTNSL